MNTPQTEPGADERFAVAVRTHRERLDLSQAAVARAANSYGHNFHQTTVARIEAGERPARLSEAVTLAEILLIDLPNLFGVGEENDRPPAREPVEAELERVQSLLEDARVRRVISAGVLEDAERNRAWHEEVLKQAREKWAEACQDAEKARMDADQANFEISHYAERVRELLVRQAPQRSPDPE